MIHHPNLAMALAASQAEFPPLQRDAEGQAGSRNYAYITLDCLVQKCTPVLCANGLVVFHHLSPQKEETAGIDAQPRRLITTLTHTFSGENIISECEMLIGSGGNQMQQMGSARTYAMRYNYGALLNLSIDQDDDGVGSAGTKATKAKEPTWTGPPHRSGPASEKQLAFMGSLMADLGYSDSKRQDIAAKVSHGKTRNAAELTSAQAGACIERLKEIQTLRKRKSKPEQIPSDLKLDLEEPSPGAAQEPDDIPMN